MPDAMICFPLRSGRWKSLFSHLMEALLGGVQGWSPGQEEEGEVPFLGASYRPIPPGALLGIALPWWRRWKGTSWQILPFSSSAMPSLRHGPWEVQAWVP